MTEISTKRLRHCPLLALCSRQVRWNLLLPKVTSEKRDDTRDFGDGVWREVGLSVFPDVSHPLGVPYVMHTLVSREPESFEGLRPAWKLYSTAKFEDSKIIRHAPSNHVPGLGSLTAPSASATLVFF
jgi:hypothetical protein